MRVGKYTIWFLTISCILISAGLIFSFFGFGFFPSSILPKNVLLSWESAIYGSVLIGWGTTLFLIGRLAFRRNDIELMKIMLLGIATWLILEAIFSAYLGVFFNVGVDLAVLTLFGVPLVKKIRESKTKIKNKPALNLLSLICT